MADAAETEGAAAGAAFTRVRYPETDRMGIAHHAHYLVWFELGRTEWMRDLGTPYAELEDRDAAFFPVVAAGVIYRASAHYDDRLRITTRLVWARRVRMRLEYTIEKLEDGSTLATGYTVHACVGRDGRPRRIPELLMRRLSQAAERSS